MTVAPLDLIKDYSEKCHINDPHFLGNHDNRSLLSFEPKISDIILNNRIKVPDLFSAGGMLSPRKIVSTRLKKILENSSEKMSIQFFPISLIQGKKITQGHWITNFVSFKDESLDFEKSTFIVNTDTPVKNKYGVYIDSVSSSERRRFKNLSEFLQIKNEGWEKGTTVFAEIPFIKESENDPILLFDEVPILGIIVSEELKKEMEKHGLRGIEFKPLEIPDEEWYGPNGLRKQFYK
ncbi:hypothetical protein KUV23_10930 [Algoriphagus marincola]|uniref:Immunity MXAN-0049 protein domain-containing protein n=1 Tax=Algoriphagus marincola TaxID=264027 RepID=A0ABS7N685_9BACT|nr:hypothetical protein [Algoriphagus marincola]MBY5951490.1 hypothetical protein [Algoriphagus marincola]